MRTLNLGILAHVDAGKTTLTERLLHAAGVIDEIGSVDDGDTQTDSLELERRRGITIKSAVVSFVLDDIVINLIDTPGHPDFIAEVERVLAVLDGVVLVVSAVEGVQAQTRVLTRTLRRLGIPTLFFVNKIDRRGARCEHVLDGISAKLTPDVVAMGSVGGQGTRDAGFTPFPAGHGAFGARLVDVLARHDDALLAAYVADESAVTHRRLREALAEQCGKALAHPVYFGSAITGAGLDPLISGIKDTLPARTGDAGGPVEGTVFKIERGPAGETIAYVRMFSGTVRVRDRVSFGRPGPAAGTAKVTAIGVFDRGTAERRTEVTAGRIAKLWGLGGIRIGDRIRAADGPTPRTAGTASGAGIGGASGAGTGTGRGGGIGTGTGTGSIQAAPERHFSPPTLETAVVPRRAADRGALHVALTQLAEQDPLIDLRRDDIRGELFVSLYGEVQKEVIEATLAADFGIEVMFRETTTLCVERPRGTGTAVEIINKDPNPFLATVGLRVEQGPTGGGVRFGLGVELGSMPYAFFRAVEDTVADTLRQGVYGWQVTDCVVTMTHSGYWPRQSHAHQGFSKSMSSTGADFRGLTPLVLMGALRRAGTTVYEPTHRFELEAPADTLGAILPVLGRLRAVPEIPRMRGSSCFLTGEIPAARVHDLRRELPGLTHGEGVVESDFGGYQPVAGTNPTRPRTDHNPLDRKEYLLRVARRVTAPPAG